MFGDFVFLSKPNQIKRIKEQDLKCSNEYVCNKKSDSCLTFKEVIDIKCNVRKKNEE